MNKLILFLAMSVPLVAQSAWIDSSGKPIPDTDSMRSAGDFGVQVVLTPNEKQFRQTWNSTEGTPKLTSTNSVRLGASVSAVIIFHGCTPSATGVCDVISQFILESPEGTKTPAGGGPVWSVAPLQGGLLQLGQASMTVGFDNTDPVGDYKVIANVKDKVSRARPYRHWQIESNEVNFVAMLANPAFERICANSSAARSIYLMFTKIP